MMHIPVISICLPTLNALRFLESRIRSILTQTLTDWELIVCDSFSDDGTWEYLQKFNDDPRVRLYQVPKEGLYAGWNECLERCRGEYVYIATADDTCSPDLLEKMVGALENAKIYGTGNINRKERKEHKEELVAEGGEEHRLDFRSQVSSLSPSSPRSVDICVCDYDVIDESGCVLDGSHDQRLPKQFYGDWMKTHHLRDGRTEFLIHACLGIVWNTVTAVVFRRSLLDRIGYFRTDLGSQADQEWEMRAALASDILYIPEKLATWRIHGGQATKTMPAHNRAVLDALESVLSDVTAGIPESWRKRPEWREKIMYVSRQSYLDAFRFYRGTLASSPMVFIKGGLLSLIKEPRFFAEQVFSGLRWNSSMSPDPAKWCMSLINAFQTPWPPVKV